jgi:tyrosyl-tRNA synthetase
VRFVFGSEIYNQEYWRKVLTIAKETTVERAKRTLTIAGRAEEAEAGLSMYFYSPMQVADVFQLGVDICQMGMDQRRADILAREVAQKLGVTKPVCVHHHVLMGLRGPRKMGTFDEDLELSGQIASRMTLDESCVYVHDSPEAIRQKIHDAFCPPKNPENPILEILRYALARDDDTSFVVMTKGGDRIAYDSYLKLEKDYSDGSIHPVDLKNSVAEALIELLEPCRRHFGSLEEWADVLGKAA